MSKIKALVLDAGGVMVHPIHGNWNIPVHYREHLGAYARDIPGKKWLEACAAEAHVQREDIILPSMEEEFAMRLQFSRNVAARMNWNLGEEALQAYARDFTYNPDRHAWYDDVLTYLPRWHEKLKMGILSDAMPSFRSIMNSHPAKDHFDAIVISTEIGAVKPNSRMYETVMQLLNAHPDECLFVDDRVCNLEGAMACGMHAVQMCRDGLEPWEKDHVCNFTELNEYLEGLI